MVKGRHLLKSQTHRRRAYVPKGKAMMRRKAKGILIAFAAVVALCVAVFLGARYGWRLAGFSFCRTAQIERVSVETGCVEIEGSWPGMFPESFVGYRAEVVDGALYVGFQYNKLLGVWIYDRGDFQIEIPVEQQIKAVYMKAGDGEDLIWPEQDAEALDGR